MYSAKKGNDVYFYVCIYAPNTTKIDFIYREISDHDRCVEEHDERAFESSTHPVYRRSIDGLSRLNRIKKREHHTQGYVTKCSALNELLIII